MRRLWLGLKAVLSLVLLIIAAALAWVFAQLPHPAGALGLAATTLFLAALPWVKLEPGSRPLALTGVVLSLGLIILSVLGAEGGRALPRDCAYRRGWCALGNLLHALGGPLLAAAPFFVAGCVLLVLSLRALRWRPRV